MTNTNLIPKGYRVDVILLYVGRSRIIVTNGTYEGYCGYTACTASTLRSPGEQAA